MVRGGRYRYDFTLDGHIRPGRVPSGDPVIVVAHGLVWVVVVDNFYILGGADAAARRSWLLTPNRPKGQDPNDARLKAGLVLAPKAYSRYSLAANAFRDEIVCHEYRPEEVSDFEYLEAKHRACTDFTENWEDLVITMPEADGPDDSFTRNGVGEGSGQLYKYSRGLQSYS